MPVIRIGDLPKENAQSKGVTDSLRISVCADDHLWKFDSNLSADEWFFDSKALKAELKDKDMDQYLRVRDKATLLAHLAKVRTTHQRNHIGFLPLPCSSVRRLGPESAILNEQ